MVVGKPDFELNSFGIQYKEKKVNYTNKRSGINISSTTQSEAEDSAEKKVMNKLKPTGTAPVETQPLTQMVDGKQVDKPEDKKFGKQSILAEDALPATSTPPTKPHEEGVFDNVPQSKEDMITQEGGSKAGKTHMKPAPPKAKLEGRATQNATIKLHESKQSPVLPKTASNDIILKMNIMKLDLIKTLASNAGSTPVAAGTKKGKPNHIGNDGVRTQDGQHTVRGHGVGTPEQVTINGVKTTQPREVAVKPKGNDKTSLAGDMQMSKELENKTPAQLKESMDYITNSPAYQESIRRNATETVQEGTEKFDNADATTNKIRARIAAREARKRGKGKKVNRAISEINSMTDGMRELMKETEVQRIKKIPANTEEEIQQKRFALSDAQRSDRMAKPDTSLLHNNKPYVPFSDRENKDL